MTTKLTPNKTAETKNTAQPVRSDKVGAQPQISPGNQILDLQRLFGNRAVQRIYESGRLQAQMKIGRAGDKYEQEADRVAGQIMRPEGSALGVNMPAALISRQENEEEVQSSPIACQISPLVQRQDEEEEIAQTKTLENSSGSVAPGVESGINALRGGGRPLPESSRAYFEPRFGADFSDVRIHNDSRAHNLATSINAKAFTTGRDVVFGSGQYAPESSHGKSLIAHELTHVVQQRGLEPATSTSRSEIKTSENGLLIGAGASIGNCASLAPLNSTAPGVQRQDVEFDLEVPTPEERERMRQRGIQLPAVSSQSADPRGHSDYVDRRITAVGFGIYLGGYVLYLDGLDIPVFVRDAHLNFGATNMAPTDLAIFPDYNDALAHIPMGPPTPGQPTPYTYYRGAGGAIIAPTLFTPATTPRVIQTALEARRQLAQYVQEQLTAVAIGIVGGMLIRGIVRWLARVGGGRGTPPPSRLSPAATRARDLARQTRARGEPVVANMGGAGAPHEPPGAININNQAVGRRGIPNHVDADASDIGQLFDTGSVDQVVGHHMPPSVINWQRAVPGIRNALRPGGTFRFDWRGATAEAAQVVRLLQEAGFREINNIADAVVTATR